MKAELWIKRFFLIILILIVTIASTVIIVDPYFHYHKPLKGLKYRLYEERYVNDGISRHFDFDMIITGTSMAQNFKPSEAEELFGKKTVKETFSGGGYKEISDNLERAINRNPKLDTVIWAIDYNGLIREKDWEGYSGIPTYLYDDNPFNDTAYLFNKSIFYHGVLNNLAMTIKGEECTSMDDYSSWEATMTGLDGIYRRYSREEVIRKDEDCLSDEERAMVEDTIRGNIESLVNEHPDVTFYLFYTPYCICYWDELHLANSLNRQLEAEEIADSILTACDNVRLYSWFDRYDLITDIGQYADKEHYIADINSDMLRWMKEDNGRLTKDNYPSFIEAERDYYGRYDYESIYK